jgi:hypothetical protein
MPAANTAAVQTATKIRATSIAITRAEGPTRLCRTRVFKTWKNASAALLAAAHTYPTSGYDKHDLVVTFADGETYSGRLDCQADGSDCNPATHIREYVEFLAGAARPSHMSEKQYSDFLRSDPARVAEAMAFLATYELAD